MHIDYPVVLPTEHLRARRIGQGGCNRGDRIFHGVAVLLAGGGIALLAGIVVLLTYYSQDSIFRFGPSFLSDSTWDPVFGKFGALPYIYGTLVTSLVALVIATPVALAAALYVAEYAPPWLREPVSFLLEMLAVIPSVIYGLWGFFVLAPILRNWIEPFLQDTLGPIPVIGALFQGSILGRDLLTGGIILSIMILPTVMAISREVILAVPNTQREGMIAIGATRWETILGAVLPYARSGIIGAAMLGLARALGETMAVTMVIGNSSLKISPSLFTPGYTMASAIANQFTEADTQLYFSAIVEVALVLLLVSAVVNVVARVMVWSFSRGPAGSVRA